MAYVVNQPTLTSPWPELDEFVRSIGPFLGCAWCALERSRVVSAPVASGGLASDALDTLATLQVLSRIPIEDPRPVARSLYEPLAWSYRAFWSRSGSNLDTLLTGALVRLAADSDSRAKRRLGVALGRNEARAYLANLLRKHRLQPSLGDGLRSTQRTEWEALSLGRKRYVLWASVRNASSEFLHSDMEEEAIRHALDREICRTISWLLGRAHSGSLAATDYCFVPGHGWRQPLILDVAMETFLPLGRRYWLESSDRWVL